MHGYLEEDREGTWGCIVWPGPSFNVAAGHLRRWDEPRCLLSPPLKCFRSWSDHFVRSACNIYKSASYGWDPLRSLEEVSSSDISGYLERNHSRSSGPGSHQKPTHSNCTTMSKSSKTTKQEAAEGTVKLPVCEMCVVGTSTFIYRLINCKLYPRDWCLLHFLSLSSIGGRFDYFPTLFPGFMNSIPLLDETAAGGGFCPGAAVEPWACKSCTDLWIVELWIPGHNGG